MLGRPVVGWIGGRETVAEHDHLAAFDTPGISVGSPVEASGHSSNPTITPVSSSWSDQLHPFFLCGVVRGCTRRYGRGSPNAQIPTLGHDPGRSGAG